MKNKILIFGSGFIGKRLKEGLGCSMTSQRISGLKDAESQINKYKPNIIINCIGNTGSKNVDGCEFDQDNTLLANSFVPVILAEAALRKKIKLIHISSGCIYHYNYSSDKPIDEAKSPDFFDLFYSRSKIYAEGALQALFQKINLLSLRIRIPLDNRPNPRNILTKLIKYKKVIDMPNSVTYIPDFIQAVKHLIKINARGIYNVVNKGAFRYPELLDIYKAYAPDFDYRVISYKNLKLIRTNLLLSTRKLEASGFKVRNIKEVLKECVENYLKY